MTAPALELRDVARRYPEGGGVRGLTLSVGRGRVAVVVGPSGCGKTTALRIAAGLVRPDRGRVLVDGRDVTDAPPERRGLGVVFQHYALFPHLTAAGNVAYGLRARGVSGEELDARTTEALRLVGLEAKGGRRLDELSGGEQQRVAVARAVAFSPPVLLLDEPLSNLDLALRRRTREELAALVRRLGLAALHVTHDQDEALALADELFVLRDGLLVQSGPPEDVYARPKTAFVARFLGGAAVVRARLAGDGVAETTSGFRFPVAVESGRADAVDLALRSERLALVPATGSEAEPTATIVTRTFLGADVVFGVALGEDLVEARVRSEQPAARFRVGDRVRVAAAGVVHAMNPEATP
jgi:iron(III) transport system ATP-binding protein